MLLAKTLLLGSEPAGSLHSLDELFALAHAMEQEAATRYTDLAEEMRRQKKVDLAEVFANLAAAEREHVDSVTRWSQSRRHKAPDPALVRWDVPDTFDAETAAEIKASRLMTPYRALAMAVRNEERAFAFWAYLSAYSKDAEIKKAAEAMAQEELGHVATLRKERRRAYHREHDEMRAGRQASAAAGHIDAGELERRLAVLVVELERAHTGAVASRAHELLMETTEMAVEATGVGRFPSSLAQGDAEHIAEALVDAYLESAETAGEPARLDELQRLAGRAIARLAWLRSLNVKSS
ncbi:ferritin-like domain-containing protein [Bradyrhizobium neotropicale]|uniref:Rubrerythrin family protein n=1 Tax=Bradyrhizobium neotropicale TaxID=1497615 RepID=A0A176ZFQ4_9BRAD|nr:ferritin family protein [Bradyrhizobium neotropicale]OAF19307.1 rubrerythrin family protein [Bradyrhizobium neotropicale]